MTPIGSLSGVVHLVAAHPVVMTVVGSIALAVAVAPTPPLLRSQARPAPVILYVPTPVMSPAPVTLIIPAESEPEPCQVSVPESVQSDVKPSQIGNCYLRYHNLDDTVRYMKLSTRTIVLKGNPHLTQKVSAYLIKSGIDPARIKVVQGGKHSLDGMGG